MSTFVHEVFTGYGFTAMRHMRETTTASGLILPQELARSVVDLDINKWVAEHTTSTLLVPPLAGPLPNSMPNERISCNDVAELTEQGIRAWREALGSLGSAAAGVELVLAEIEQEPAQPVPGKLILPDNETRPPFVGYRATADEIEALDTMVRTINDSLRDNDAPGNYL